MFEVCFTTILKYYLPSGPASVEFFLRLPLLQSILLYISLCPFLLLLIAIARPGWHSVVDLTKRQMIEFDPHSKQLLSTSFHDRSGIDFDLRPKWRIIVDLIGKPGKSGLFRFTISAIRSYIFAG